MYSLRYRLYKLFYKFAPKQIRKAIEQSKLADFFRAVLTHKKGEIVLQTVEINRYNIPFLFTASLKAALRASERGIENQVCRLIEHFCQTGMTCLDIGANYGYITIVMGNAVYPNGKVFSLEVSEHFYETLVHNVEQNELSSICEPMHCAIAWHELSKRKTNTLLANIPHLTLDDLLQLVQPERLDIIKLDIDGMEHAVIASGLLTLARYRPVLIIEINDHEEEIQSILSELDYEFANTLGQPIDQMKIPYNLVAFQAGHRELLW